jgi:hypothetical protein
MKSFLTWLFVEKVNASQIQWIKKDPQGWDGQFSIGNVRFTLEFWNYVKKNGAKWEVMFQQTTEKGYVKLDGQSSLGLLDLAKLFQTIEEGIIELLETNQDVEQLIIHPEALYDNRRNMLIKRSKSELTAATTSGRSDPGKFNAYLHLFQYSRLKQMGFSMTQDGEKLIIKRPVG